MKNIKLIIGALVISFFAVSCDFDGINNDVSLNTTPTSNLNKIFDISTDNSGKVKITPKGEAVSSFKVEFGHGSGTEASAVVLPGGSVTHVYPEGNYTVKITSYDLAGKATENTYPLNILFTAPTDLAINSNLQGHNIKLTALAKNAAGGFLVYFGDVANEVGTKVGGTLNNDKLIESPQLSHTYATAGNYTVKIVALSGGAATSIKTQNITIFDPFSLPVSFENPFINYGIGGTFGGVDAGIVDNPSATGLNTSAKVWKFTKNSGAANWAGTWTPLASPGGVPISIDNGSKFKVMVYATEAGKNLHFQLEDGTNYKPGVDVAIPVANQWVELTFDFASLGITPGYVFTQYVFQYNLSGNGEGEVIYIDNITQTN